MAQSQLIFLVHNVHRGGGQERASYEVIQRLKAKSQIVVIASRCEIDDVTHIPIWTPSKPAVLQTGWYKASARRALHRIQKTQSSATPKTATITTGIGASGGPVDVAIAQYCQEAYRQRIGPVRANSFLKRWWHRRVMARFCAEERAVYQSPQLKRVIAVSHGVGKELIDFYGVDPAIIRYIPNGVDLSVFKPLEGGAAARIALRRELGLPTDGFLACFVGGDWRRKGLAAAIQAIGQVPESHLVIVGTGDETEFKAVAAAANAGARVHFVGKQPQPHRYLQASDAYVFPSLYEAFSLSCIEAAACGLPLVVTKINGAEELVEDGINGFFVDHDAGSIAARLKELILNPSLRDRLANRAALDAKIYDWDIIAAAHKAVYAELEPQIP